VNIKNFIDYENEIKQCSVCKEMLPFSAFTKTHLGYPQSKCKACKSNYVANRRIEKRMLKNPHLYYQCDNDDCAKIWYRKTYGKVCPNCFRISIDENM